MSEKNEQDLKAALSDDAMEQITGGGIGSSNVVGSVNSPVPGEPEQPGYEHTFIAGTNLMIAPNLD